MSNNNHVCFVELKKKWDGPIEKPVGFNRKTGELISDWRLRMFKYTKSGNISKSGGGWLIINYCPICGEGLADGKN